MGIGYGTKIPEGLCFNFDALNPKCFDTSARTFTDIISGVTGNTVGDATKLSLESGLGSPHLKFTPGATTRTAYINFPVANMNMPTTSFTISIWSYFIDQGSIDHPMCGWETDGGWIGTDGWIIGTGWGTDGTRVGVNGTSIGYSGMENTKWIHWVVTWNSGETNGIKLYKNNSVILQGTASGSLDATNNLCIGATNVRGGNWGGYMDLVQIWDRALTQEEIKKIFEIQKGRFEL